MPHRPPFVFLVLLATLLGHATSVAADARGDEPTPPLHDRKIRTTDARARALIEHGTRVSETFRELIRRLERSDVVVYVICDRVAAEGIAGRLTFISAAGGVRYVAIRIAPLDGRAQQVAILGHELQHAVEVADHPEIVDGPSLARVYERIGHISRVERAGAIAFDSEAAVLAGRRVLKDLVTGGGRGRSVFGRPFGAVDDQHVDRAALCVEGEPELLAQGGEE